MKRVLATVLSCTLFAFPTSLIAGENFDAPGLIARAGTLQVQGQDLGNRISFAIYDSSGQQTDHGECAVTAAMHMSLTHCCMKSIVSGSTAFHVSHPAQ